MQMRNLALWGVLIVMFLVMVTVSQNAIKPADDLAMTTSEFMTAVEEGRIDDFKVDVESDTISGKTKAGKEFKSNVPITGELLEKFDELNVTYDTNPRKQTSLLANFLFSVLPFILFIGIAIWFMRSMQGGGKGGAMSFGKSRAKMLTEDQAKITFDDVAGVENAKEDLQEVIEFLQDPTKFQRLGAKIPTGALLIGPPGTGKTLLAKAVAGEAQVPFFTISGSDFVEMFVGVGASRVRDMFDQGRKSAPCIIFIDEIDAVGRHRGVGTSGGHEEREQTLNQLLVEMDGFDGQEGVIIIAATNRPDVLDQALLRPGRFDRQIEVPLPDIMGREKILAVHMKKVPTAKDVDNKYIARGTPGMSGADLANLVNEAALLAARRNKRKVTMREFEDARDKVLMGAERRSLSMTDEERANTAYHEAGHAIVGMNMPGAHPIHKATIIPRGRALGMVQYLPERDQISQSREQMIASMAMAMGGRAAEELKFGYDKVTSGASSDIEQVTRIARAMVTEWGLSDAVGPIAYKNTDVDSFMPGIGRGSAISPETARLIEDEIKRFVTEAHITATAILKKKKKDWYRLSEALLEYETLSGDEIKSLLKDNIKPKRPDFDNDSGTSSLSAIPITKPKAKAKPKAKSGKKPKPLGDKPQPES